MPSWGEVLEEINGRNTHPVDVVRRDYLKLMHEYTGRNVIAYYSGFLQKQADGGLSIDDNDKNAFMQCVYDLDKSKGLDLILHTPGGQISATESIVDYLKSIFGNNIRVFIPQIAMSAGTMIALSAKEIVMGKESNIGPIDPQFGGVSCGGVLEEFQKAIDEIKKDPESAPIWINMINKYPPTFVGDCDKAIKWSQSMVSNWLQENMFIDCEDKENIARRITYELGNHQTTFAHDKHINVSDAEKLGLKITRLETLDDRKIGGCKDLQDCVLTIHHAYMHTFSITNCLKIVENHQGKAMVIQATAG